MARSSPLSLLHRHPFHDHEDGSPSPSSSPLTGSLCSLAGRPSVTLWVSQRVCSGRVEAAEMDDSVSLDSCFPCATAANALPCAQRRCGKSPVAPSDLGCLPEAGHRRASVPPAIGTVFGVSRKPSDSVGAEAAWAPSPPLGSSYFILSFMLHQCQSSLRPLVCRTSGPLHMPDGLLSASRCHPFPRCSHALRPGERSTPPPLPEWLPCGVPRRAHPTLSG